MVYKYFVSTILLFLAVSATYPGPKPLYTNVVPAVIENYTKEIYSCLGDSTLNPDALSLGLIGQKALVQQGLVARRNLLTIIDFSRPSNENRFFVIDIDSKKIVFKTLVAHGRNSGDLYATHFSNRPQSHQSALGFYLTGDPYIGGQGYSLLMCGVDTGYNDNARQRSIVIHGADYVTQKYIQRYGRLGRSFGCPALPPEINSRIIDEIKDGSIVFGYYPDENYINGSKILASFKFPYSG